MGELSALSPEVAASSRRRPLSTATSPVAVGAPLLPSRRRPLPSVRSFVAVGAPPLSSRRRPVCARRKEADL